MFVGWRVVLGFTNSLFFFFLRVGFELKNKTHGRYPAKTITDTDFANDIAILANGPAQAENLLHSLE